MPADGHSLDLSRTAASNTWCVVETPATRQPVGAEDMTSWVRFHVHPDPAIGRMSCTALWKAGHYAASVVEPEGESRVPERVLCGEDTDAAKAKADDSDQSLDAPGRVSIPRQSRGL